MGYLQFVVAALAWSFVAAVPNVRKSVGTSAGSALDAAAQGNERFRHNMDVNEPTMLQDLTKNGQSPDFMFLGCSDSRVSEGTVFDARVGTFFTARNIANQLQPHDVNTHATLSYAVTELGVQHIVVMGHYGCGGIAAAIASPPVGYSDAASAAIQSWIAPIRTLYATSQRREIVTLRHHNHGLASVSAPPYADSGYRAVVEENIKHSVASILQSSVIQNHYRALLKGNTTQPKEAKPLRSVFVHGWVYDLANGMIHNLNVSSGPPGVAIPPTPFEAVAAAKRAARSYSAMY